MVDTVSSTEGGSKKRTFSSFLASWFPFLTSPASTDGKRSSAKRFTFKRKSVEKEAPTANLEEPVVPPLSVVTFRGNASNGNSDMARPQSERKSIKKRASSRRFKGLSRGKSQKFEITEDMINLQRIICDAGYRQRLVELLVPLDGESSVKVRFCSAVEEYQREKDKKLKKKKGYHIVKMFIKKGSMFRLKSVTKEQETSLRAKKYEVLETLKNVILDELVLNKVVAKTMNDILATENLLKDKETPSDNTSSELTE